MADKPTPDTKPTNEGGNPLKDQALAIYAERYGADKAKNAEVVLKQTGATEVLFWINGVPIKVKKG